jgi:cytidylate kinase
MLVAIDGPAGAGKSTVARAVAAALGFTYLDTGAMYRCVGLARLRDPGADPAALRIEVGERIRLDGEDVTEAIRTPEASEQASRVSGDPAVREAMVAKQRELIASGDWVAEGRDIGTVVAPDAELKVWLTASPEERARRRAAELGVDLAAVTGTGPDGLVRVADVEAAVAPTPAAPAEAARRANASGPALSTTFA